MLMSASCRKYFGQWNPGLFVTMLIQSLSLPRCGLNGAVYFSQMDEDGGLSKFSTNKAGAKYGTGYCDSQCPRDIKFINGEANVDGWGGSVADPTSGAGKYGKCRVHTLSRS